MLQDYLVATDSESLLPLDESEELGGMGRRKVLLLVAAWVGETRLIDNVHIDSVVE